MKYDKEQLNSLLYYLREGYKLRRAAMGQNEQAREDLATEQVAMWEILKRRPKPPQHHEDDYCLVCNKWNKDPASLTSDEEQYLTWYENTY